MGHVLNTITLLAALTIPPEDSVMTLSRFPSLEVAQQSLAFNHQAEESLLARQAFQARSWWEVQDALNDCRQSGRAWYWLCSAHGAWSDYTRTLALNALHAEIGDAAYYAGTLPCPIPLWYTYGD